MSLRKGYSLSTNSPCTPNRNTSTPFPMRRKSILPSRSSSILSRRYSLSDVDCLSPIQRNSTFFNQKNVSNLLNSPNNSRKSPENKERLLINHQQMKYSTPGVFPIVHLNKPNLPILKEKSKNINVQLASPELCRQNSVEHNRLLLEKIVQNCSKLKTTGITTTTISTATTTTNRNIDISTRSVLDALKEISRKRIHTSEELDYLDDGKRIRLDNNNNNNDDLLLNLKRTRGESPPHESYQNSSKQQQIKKQCSMNEILASQSSMEIKSSPPPPPPSVAQATNENKQNSRSREIQVEVDIHRPSKKPNLVNAETQTQITENVKDVGVQSKESIPVSIDINKENIEKTTTVETTSTTVKSSACLKVFDEAPLERARKDRLSVLMGIKKQSSDMKTNQEEKPIMSILSSNKHLKSPASKHVTFNLESEPSSESNQQQQQIVEKTINSTVNNDNLSITQTTASITTPLISSVINETPKLPDKDILQTSNETKIVPKIASSLNQTTTTQSIPTFNFNATTSVDNSTNSTKLINPVTSIVTATTSNMFENSNKIGNLPITTAITTTTTGSTPPKIGGFKFDLNPKTAKSSSKFTLVTSTTTTTTESSQKPAFFFGGVTKNTPTTQPVLTTTTVTPKFSFTSSITTTTAAVTTTTTPVTSFTQSGFGGTGGFSFTPQTTQSFINPVTTTTVGLTSTFGNQPIKSNVFGKNPVVTTNTFGIQPTVSNIFGGITTQTTTAGTKSTFGAAQPTNIFGGIATTTTAVAVTTIGTTTSTFGIPPIQSTTFGSNQAPTFGTSGFSFGASNSFTTTNSNDKPSFGNLQTPQQNLFAPTTTTISPTIATTTTTSSIFNTNVFNSTNTTNNPPVFGLNNPPTTNIFGSSIPTVTTTPQNPPLPSTFGFDVNKPTGFNTTSTTPAFGSTTFGTTNQNQPVFGNNLNNNNNNNNQPTQASSPPGGVFTFGANTANKPTGVFSFGQSEPPKPTFNFTANATNSTVGASSGGLNNSFTNGNVSFGANPVTPQFNPPVGGAMFSIGSGGSSTPRARTQLKAKRRT